MPLFSTSSVLRIAKRFGLRRSRDAEDVDVQQGRVRLIDQQVNAEADTAADLGRRHQSEMLIDAWRGLLRARSHWYPIMLDLHRFMIAVARVSVSHDCKGGTAPDPLVWDQGSKPKVSRFFLRTCVWRSRTGWHSCWWRSSRFSPHPQSRVMTLFKGFVALFPGLKKVCSPPRVRV